MSKTAFSASMAKIVGNAREGVWAQVATLENLWAVLVLEGDKEEGKSGPPAGEAGREILSFLEEESQKIEKRNLAELSSIAQKIRGKPSAQEKLSLILALPSGEAIYLTCLNGAAFLRRGGKFTKIAGGEESVSGFLKDGDLLILGSEQFFQIATPQFLAENLNHNSAEEIAEILAPKVSLAEDNAGCAALILSFKTKEEVEEEVEEEQGEDQEDVDQPQQVNISDTSLAPRATFFPRLGQKIKLWKGKLSFSNRPLFLPSAETWGGSRKTLLTVALFLIVLLGASIFFGLNKTREGEKHKQFEEIYQSANFNYEEGKGLVGLNDVLARQRLSEAKDQLEAARQSPLDKNQEKKVKELEEKIKESSVVLSRVYNLDQLPLYWETGLIRSGSKAVALSFYGEEMAILDSQNRLAHILSAKTKAVESLPEEGLKEEPKLLGFDGENVYLWTSEGISRLGVRSKKLTKVIEKDDKWGEITAIVAYGGNIYLLDRGNSQSEEAKTGQIWKYLGTETGFSSKRSYFPSDIKPDLSQAKKMAIDGSVWVLSPGQILRFTSGRPDNFVILGLETNFGQPQAIFTNEKTKNIYLLDQEGKKVLVLSKDGAYQSQYVAEEIGQVQDLVVLEEEKKIFLLAGSKIYYIEIKP